MIWITVACNTSYNELTAVFFHASATPSYHTHFGRVFIIAHCPHPVVYACKPCHKFLPLWCVAIPRIWITISWNMSRNECTMTISMPPLLPTDRTHFGRVLRMDYGPHPVVYSHKPCQRCLLLCCVAIHIIWITIAWNTSCNECTMAISMLLLLTIDHTHFGKVLSMDYGPHPVVYACKPCQSYFPSSCVAIPIIQNTVACNTSCNKHNKAISMLPLLSLIIPILVGMLHVLWYPPCCRCTQAISDVFTLALCGHTYDPKHRCMKYVM